MNPSKRIGPLILASRSPRRQLLLRQIGLKFFVRPSSIKERMVRGESPVRTVRRLALEKAGDVASRRREGIVVGADTIVVVGRTVLGKPRSAQEAVRMLRRLSGRWHSVFTGYALVDARTGRRVSDVVRTRVRFRSIAAGEIRRYVASGSPLDKAGAYGIQDDYGAVFVEEVRGCFYNVVGFPLSRFMVSLSAFTGNSLERLTTR